MDGYVPSARSTQEKMIHPLDGGEVPLQPWAESLYRERLSKDKTADAFMNSAAYCLPLGMPSMMLGATYPFSILQTPGQVTTVHEEGHVHRQIFLNRPHDADPDPGYLGESVGRWEGSTLVVDTIGLNDRTSLDLLGIPHSDQLHIVERIRRLSHDKLERCHDFRGPEGIHPSVAIPAHLLAAEAGRAPGRIFLPGRPDEYPGSHHRATELSRRHASVPLEIKGCGPQQRG